MSKVQTVTVIEGEIKLVQNFVDTASKPADTSRLTLSDPATWIKMLGFYRERLEALHTQLRSTAATVVKLNSDLDKINAQLEQLNANAGKPELRVIVGLSMKQAGDVRLELRYVVQGPAWHPSYDLRVSSETKVMTLIYKAEVVQQTGEVWKDVALTFSTAKPHIGASHPELSPWYVQSFDRYLVEQRESARRNTQMVNAIASVEQSSSFGGAEFDLSEPMERAQAQVNNEKSSVSFQAARAATIESTGQPFQVTLAVIELPLYFRYSAVPKLSQSAFLKVKATNTTGFPLISGKANCYLDTIFVASNELDYIAPGAEFWVFLGADERIIVDYQIVKEFEEKAGMAGKKTRKTLEYLTTITNHLNTPEEIVVWDQLPIARNDELEVKLLKPDYHGDTDSLKLSKEQFLEWYYKIEPGKTVTIPFSFSILYPENQVLRNIK